MSDCNHFPNTTSPSSQNDLAAGKLPSAARLSGGTLQIGNGGTTGTLGSGAVINNSILTFNRGFAIVANVISGSGVVNQNGVSQIIFNGANSYTGQTNVNAGVLSLGNATALGTTAGGTVVAVGGSLDLSGQSIGAEAVSIQGAGNATIGSPFALTNSLVAPSSLAGPVTLTGPATVGGNPGTGSITLTNTVSGAFSLTKAGTNTLILSGANTYSGGTNVNEGRLLANNASGSGTGTGAVAVNFGGTLGGTGSISGAVTVNSGGHIAPGASIESLAVGSLLLNTGSILDFELGAPGAPGVNSDLINVTATGGLTLSGGSVVLTNAGGLAIGTYRLIDYVGTLGGALPNLGTPTGPAGFSYALLNNLGNTSIDLTVSLLGDYSGNGVIDAADYVLWRKSPNTYGGTPGGYNTWRANFGATPGAGSGSAIPSAGALSPAVPEPASAWLLILGTIVATWRGRRIASHVPPRE